MKRRHSARNNLIGLGILVLMAVCVIYFGRMAAILGFGNDRFYDGIYINGIAVGGYTYQEAEEILTAKVEEFLSTQYSMSFGSNTWTFSAKDVNGTIDITSQLQRGWNMGHIGSIFERQDQVLALRVQPVYLVSDLQYDEETLNVFVDGIDSAVDRQPVDAQVALEVDGPTIMTESQVGYEMDEAALKDTLLTLMSTGSEQTGVTLPVEEVQPQVSSDVLSGGMEIIAENTTDTSISSSKRLKNVSLALSKFNAFQVNPGDEVSFNNIVGKRTKANGFNEAPEYAGITVTTGVGGGVCQASSTLYGALLKAGMTIVQRSNHTMVVSYTSPSFDAAVSDSGKDLVFRNDTDKTIYIYTRVNKDVAAVRIYGNKRDYRVEIESVITEDNIANKNVQYENDVEGKYVTYVDETKLKSKGKRGVRSVCIRHYYDWDTGEEVSSEQVSSDYYYPQPDTYWRGVTPR